MSNDDRRQSPHDFDPDAAAQPGTGVFGLPFTFEESGCVLVPAPFDATTSYGGGASAGPEAIRTASAQVDLFDLQFGRIYQWGLFMEEQDEAMLAQSKQARALAAPIIEKGGAEDADAPVLEKVNRASEAMNRAVEANFERVLKAGKVPGLVGGDHSTPFGAIRACAAKAGPAGLGILHVDAHMDLRDAFEGFVWSHASIMFNVLERIPSVTRLVQVGIRDFGEGELNVMKGSNGRVVTHFDLDLFRRASRGESWQSTCEQMIEPLPKDVYVSFDIDALDPSLCPNTGTPVPGGLSFNQACVLLEVLARSGRRVIGFDLNEVCPAADGANEWDANVGARVLYKLCGTAWRANGASKDWA